MFSLFHTNFTSDDLTMWGSAFLAFGLLGFFVLMTNKVPRYKARWIISAIFAVIGVVLLVISGILG